LQITTPPADSDASAPAWTFQQAAHNGDQKSFCLHVDGIGSFEVFTKFDDFDRAESARPAQWICR